MPAKNPARGVNRFATLAALTLLAVTSIGAALAADLSRMLEFNIASQPLNDALVSFTRQSGVQVTSPAQIVEGKSSSAVVGKYSARAALEILLKGTGLAYDVIGTGTVTLRSTSSAPASQAVGSGVSDRTAPQSSADSVPDAAAWASTQERSDAGTGPDRDGASGNRLEEIVVTATKRSERLLDTPQSVTVLSAEAISSLGAKQFSDFAGMVPGLSFTTGGEGYTKVALRGVTSLTDSPTVGIYVDDVPYGSSTGFGGGGSLALDVGLFDVDRIEVLRGPQGTLYGASTMGGLIKYVTKAPTTESFNGEVQAGFAATHAGGIGYTGSAVVNVPLVEGKLAARASVFSQRDGGYIDNVTLNDKDVNRADIYGGRLDVLYTPTDALHIRIDGYLQNISRDGTANADYTLKGVPIGNGLEQQRLFQEAFEQHFRNVSGTLSYDFGGTALTSISSYQTVRTQLLYDLSAEDVPLYASFGAPFNIYGAFGFPLEFETKKFTQEVRLASTGETRLEWLVGAFYTHEAASNSESFILRDLAQQPLPNDLFSETVPTHYEEISGFGNLTYHLNSRFDVSGGIRYAHNRQDFTQSGSGLIAATTPTRDSEESVVTYLANARYHINSRATAYLRYATGYRPGGPNYVTNDPATGVPVAPATFKSDKLKSYEGGVKAETADHTFAVDVAGYSIDWSSIQIGTRVNGLFVIENAPAATIRGMEMTVTARPVSRFSGTATFAYQDARLSEASPELGGAKDERLPDVPRVTGTLSADYKLPFADRVVPTIGATVRYVSDRTASFNMSKGTPQYRLPDYTTIDVRAGFDVGPVSIQAYIHNLADRRGQLSSYTGYAILGGPAEVAILPPRTIGFSATSSF